MTIALYEKYFIIILSPFHFIVKPLTLSLHKRYTMLRDTMQSNHVSVLFVTIMWWKQPHGVMLDSQSKYCIIMHICKI